MDIGKHTLLLLEPLVHKRDVGLHHVNLPPQFGAFSGLVYRWTLSNLHINTSAMITWECDPPFAAMGWQPQSQGLLSIQSTSIACGATKNGVFRCLPPSL